MTAECAGTRHRILVWGAGAVGGTVGAHLVRAGHDITFVDTARPHVEAIADIDRGLLISGPVSEFRIHAAAVTPDQLWGTWDRVFLAVKAHHTAEACTSLLPHLSHDGYVVSLQNGLCEAVIAEFVGGERTIGAFVNLGADWIAPGEILYSNRGALVIGELDGRLTPRIREVHALLQVFEPCARITSCIWSHLWGKLGYAALLFAQAVGELGIADCLARPELLPLWRGLAGEVVHTAIAEGVVPCGSDGFDSAAFGPDGTEDSARASVEAMIAFYRPNTKTHSGVWRDLVIHHRPTEVDAQLGTVLRIAGLHGVGCPKLTALVGMVHEIENGCRRVSDDNLRELLKA